MQTDQEIRRLRKAMNEYGNLEAAAARAGMGKVHLFRGKMAVKKHIPENDAVGELFSLVKSEGYWSEEDDSGS